MQRDARTTGVDLENSAIEISKAHGFIKTRVLIFESAAPQHFQKLNFGFY
jgi:hypothetical protein